MCAEAQLVATSSQHSRIPNKTIIKQRSLPLMTNSGASSKQWRFFRAGGFDQVKLETGSDLLALDQLDLKLWVALACPTVGLEFDKTTLTMLDTDKDGRIRAPELIAAVKWTGELIKNPDNLMKGSPTLPLNAIN